MLPAGVTGKLCCCIFKVLNLNTHQPGNILLCTTAVLLLDSETSVTTLRREHYSFPGRSVVTLTEFYSRAYVLLFISLLDWHKRKDQKVHLSQVRKHQQILLYSQGLLPYQRRQLYWFWHYLYLSQLLLIILPFSLGFQTAEESFVSVVLGKTKGNLTGSSNAFSFLSSSIKSNTTFPILHSVISPAPHHFSKAQHWDHLRNQLKQSTKDSARPLPM